MSSLSTSARPRYLRASLVLALAAFATLALASVASAAPATGEVVLTLKNGAKSSLLREGVKLTPRNGKGKTQTVKLGVADLDLGAATIQTGAALTFSARGKSLKLGDVQLEAGPKSTAISGRQGGKRKVFFRATGAPTVIAGALSVNGPLALTGEAAKALRTALGLDGITGGKLGSAAISAQVSAATPVPAPPAPEDKKPEPDPLVDPYLAQCGVAATSKVTGTLPAAGALPTLTGAKTTTGPAALTWGFKAGFRSYVVFGASGTLQTLEGASTNGAPPVISSFNFPVTAGSYADNDPVDMTDDQAVIDGSGKALFCATGHEFRVVISNPTVVIDGEDSRIVADVDTNLTGVWTPSQRIDLADLDLDGITPFYNHSGAEVTWSDIPATLTESGAEAICGTGACSYVEGTELDPIDLAVKTPYDTGAGDAAAWDALATYVSTELPFPLPDPIQGGCEVGLPAGGSSANARTIDEHVGYGGTGSLWYENAAPAKAAPDLSAKTALTGGKFDWGFRSSLRGSINASGEFNLLGTTTSHTPYYGHGPGATAPPAVPGVGQMGGAGKYFRWPQATGSYYDAVGAGNADDRLVLRASGRVAFCQTQSAQRYATIFSNPTVIIDGANSRITIDVATRYRLSWVRGVVDFATLDLGGATVEETSAAGTTTVSWTFPDPTGTPTAVGPVKLTKEGERVVRVLSGGIYVEGLSLDGVGLAASFPTPVP